MISANGDRADLSASCRSASPLPGRTIDIADQTASAARGLTPVRDLPQDVSSSGPSRVALMGMRFAALTFGVASFAVMYAMIDEVGDEKDGIARDGEILRNVLIVEQSAASVDVFVAQRQLALASTGGAEPIPGVQLAEAVDAIDGMQAAVATIALRGDAVAVGLGPAVSDLRAAFHSYVNTHLAADLNRLGLASGEVRAAARDIRPLLEASTAAHFEGIEAQMALLRWSLIGSIGVALPVLVALAAWMAVKYRRAVAHAQRRGAALQHAHQVQLRRNAQFAGLYELVTEVTETLSLDHVVAATVRETSSLVDADAVALRLLRGQSLVLAGVQIRPGVDPPAFPHDVALGRGPVGRAARLGRTIRGVGQVQSELPSDGGPESSVVVVPLIVGARVVGTVSCWSALPDHFGDEDLELLEMMASQVATAVAAADLHEATDHHAQHDALTELPNRRQLQDDTVAIHEASIMSGAKLAVAMIDVDHFKLFNDEYGHQAGDVALQCVASTLAASVRDVDYVYRYGGEEFAIVFSGIEVERALEACERIRNLVAAAVVGETPEMKVTISMGLAVSPGPYKTFRDVLFAADGALYCAKSDGRDSVALAEPGADTGPPMDEEVFDGAEGAVGAQAA